MLTPEARGHLRALATLLAELEAFTPESIEGAARAYAEANALKLGGIAQPLRAALTGSAVSPPIFTAAALLGREAVLARIAATA